MAPFTYSRLYQDLSAPQTDICSVGGPWSDQPVMEFFKSILDQLEAGQPAGRIVDSLSEVAK